MQFYPQPIASVSNNKVLKGVDKAKHDKDKACVQFNNLAGVKISSVADLVNAMKTKDVATPAVNSATNAVVVNRKIVS